MAIKIWVKKEMYKGYIPYDKVNYRGHSFEYVGMSYFGIDYKNFKKKWDSGKNRDKLITQIKNKVKVEAEKKFNQYNIEQKYRIVYLNINRDGIDMFVHR